MRLPSWEQHLLQHVFSVSVSLFLSLSVCPPPSHFSCYFLLLINSVMIRDDFGILASPPNPPHTHSSFSFFSLPVSTCIVARALACPVERMRRSSSHRAPERRGTSIPCARWQIYVTRQTSRTVIASRHPKVWHGGRHGGVSWTGHACSESDLPPAADKRELCVVSRGCDTSLSC